MPKKIIGDIEILRALAVLFALFHHRQWLLPSASLKGLETYLTFWSGVDLFFVISGFVIGKGLIERGKRAQTKKAFGREMIAFWIRRIWRIWPTVWFWMLIPLLFSLSLGGEMWGEVPKNLKTVAAILGGVENIHAYFCERIQGIRGSFAYGPFWSLSLEEQFYLFLPLLLFFVKKKSLPWILAGVIAVQFFLPRPVWSFLYAIRSDALLWGVLIALGLENKKLRATLEPRFLSGRFRPILATGLLLCASAFLAAGHGVPFFLGPIGLVSALLVWLASYDKNYIWPQGSGRRFLMWVGARSYAIYLIHVPAYFMTREIWAAIEPPSTRFGGAYTLRFVLTALPLIAALAEANYRFLETPLRLKGARRAEAFLKAGEKGQEKQG